MNKLLISVTALSFTIANANANANAIIITCPNAAVIAKKQKKYKDKPGFLYSYPGVNNVKVAVDNRSFLAEEHLKSIASYRDEKFYFLECKYSTSRWYIDVKASVIVPRDRYNCSGKDNDTSLPCTRK